MSWSWGMLVSMTENINVLFFSATFSNHMKDFIRAVEQIEDEDPGLGPGDVLKMLRKAAGLNDAFIQYFLPDAEASGSELPAKLSEYLRKAVHHKVLTDTKEEGVVLTPDGSTVALGPLLLGIEAGLLSKTRGEAPGLYQLTLAKDLGLSLRHAHTYGYNSKGYGVSFIGNFQSRLPSTHSMDLVRNQLASCAVSGKRLVSSYIIKGHRDMVSTACPGDAFYQEIRRWDHYVVSMYLPLQVVNSS
uniref:Peptidoglycan recognition protein family domain-containing protein n=1 Tax=Cyprinodon variegatus TaxID=28743 RepID=A0A3Q2DY98_CYPVA